MNYILQMNGFWNWRRLNELTSKQADLYFAILNCGNSLKWKNPFNIPNSTLQSMCQMSKSELHKQRNMLIQTGLIRYENGKKGTAGMYSIVPLYETNVDTNLETNVDTHMDTHMDTNADTGVGNIHKQKYKQKQNKKEKQEKAVYGEFGNVSLSAAEYGKLAERFGETKATEYIERLSGYMASKGVRYKSHYATILNWSKKDVGEADNKASPPKQTSTKFTNFSQDKLDFADIERRALAGGMKHVE